MNKKILTIIWLLCAMGAYATINQYNVALMKRQLERCATEVPADVSIAMIVNGRDTLAIGDSSWALSQAMYYDRLFRGTDFTAEERDSILSSLISSESPCLRGESRLPKPLRQHKAMIAHRAEDDSGVADAGIVLYKGQYYAIAVSVVGDSLSTDDKEALIAEVSEVAFNNVMLGAPKLNQKRGHDPYKLGYDDGWDAGYEDGCYRQGWMTNWYTDDYRGSNRQAYLQGYREGYRDGFEEGKEDYEWEPGDDPDPDWEY